MFRIVTGLLLLLAAAPSLAGEARLSWAEVTERTDGTPVQVAGYRVYWGNEPGTHPSQATTAQTEYTVDGLGAGTWYFVVTAFDSDGLESDPSAEVSKTFADAPPLPPEPAVQEETVYGLVQSTDRLALVPVGTVPVGTQCDDQFIRDANGVEGHVVPRDAVQWSGTVRPRVVVAQCG